MNKRTHFFILLFVFVGAILSAPLCAQTVSTEDFSTYTNMSIYWDDSGPYNVYSTFSASGITWTSSFLNTSQKQVSVTNYYWKWCDKNRDWTYYRFSPLHGFMNLPYGCSLYLTSSYLTNVSSITLYLMRTADYEDNSLYLATSLTGKSNEYWTTVASMPASDFTAVLNSSAEAESFQSAHSEYDSSLFSRFQYTFETPFTGYLRIHFPYMNGSGNGSSILVPSISVTHNVPDPADCTNCFQVTF